MYPRWEPLSPCTFMLCTTEKVKQTKIYSGDKKKVKINQEETAKYLLTRLHLVDLSAPAFSPPSLRAPLCLSLPQKSLPWGDSSSLPSSPTYPPSSLSAYLRSWSARSSSTARGPQSRCPCHLSPPPALQDIVRVCRGRSWPHWSRCCSYLCRGCQDLIHHHCQLFRL